jgi:hypothetical protein
VVTVVTTLFLLEEFCHHLAEEVVTGGDTPGLGEFSCSAESGALALP